MSCDLVLFRIRWTPTRVVFSGVDHRPDRCNGEAERRLRQDDHRFHVLVRSEGGAEGELMIKKRYPIECC